MRAITIQKPVIDSFVAKRTVQEPACTVRYIKLCEDQFGFDHFRCSIVNAVHASDGNDRRITINGHITEKMADILQNAIKIYELSPKQENSDLTKNYINAAKNQNNEPYIVRFVVDRYTHNLTQVDVLYSADAKNRESKSKESAGSFTPPIAELPATVTDSVISIDLLLRYVNK